MKGRLRVVDSNARHTLRCVSGVDNTHKDMDSDKHANRQTELERFIILQETIDPRASTAIILYESLDSM